MHRRPEDRERRSARSTEEPSVELAPDSDARELDRGSGTSFDLAFLSTWPVVFDGGSLEARPLGGSESAVIEVARRFASRGLSVAVFCPTPGDRSGVWDGVTYAPHEPAERALASGELRVETLVVVRDPTRCILGRHAHRTLLWIQDMPMEGLRRQHREAVPYIDKILAVSRFQRDRFVAVFGLPPDLFLVTRNGVDAARYRPWREPVPSRLVHCSTPFRGLRVLLDAFPAIRRAVPEATLHAYSGMRVYDQTDAPFADLYERARTTPGVTLHEPVTQPELIDALKRSALMVYPATFNETSCIAAMMAISAGAPVVAAARAGLVETVGDCGVLVEGDAKQEPGFAGRFAEAVVGLLRSPDRLQALRGRCAARDLDWRFVVDEWWSLVVD